MSAFSKALSPAVREVRLLLSQTGPQSEGARAFLQSAYPAFKKVNPAVPFLVREATGVPARAFARFERGVERHVNLDGLSEGEVSARVLQLLESKA